jgi:NAD(P)-dependent dehydrogenase (short-subunit alcohol dehydrogenase family)
VRTAIVTGAARGIGAAIATRLAQDGLRVVVADLSAEAAGATAAALPGEGHIGLSVDVRDETSVDRLFDAAEAALGPVGVLVCNAGVLLLRDGGQRPAIVDTTLDEWEQSHAVNTRGTFLSVRAMLRRRIGAAGRRRGASSRCRPSRRSSAAIALPAPTSRRRPPSSA